MIIGVDPEDPGKPGSGLPDHHRLPGQQRDVSQHIDRHRLLQPPILQELPGAGGRVGLLALLLGDVPLHNAVKPLRLAVSRPTEEVSAGVINGHAVHHPRGVFLGGGVHQIRGGFQYQTGAIGVPLLHQQPFRRVPDGIGLPGLFTGQAPRCDDDLVQPHPGELPPQRHAGTRQRRHRDSPVPADHLRLRLRRRAGELIRPVVLL